MTGLTPIVGIDPGGRSTGIIARAGERLIDAWVIERPRSSPMTDHGDGLAAWQTDVLRVICDAVLVAASSTSALKSFGGAVEHTAVMLAGGGLVALAVEEVRKPSPHQRRTDGNALINVDGILATAALVGAIRTAFPDTIGIPPGGNGSHVLDAYPTPLRPRGPMPRGGDRFRHARSAWDVAGAARFMLAARRSSPPPAPDPARVHTIGLTSTPSG